MRVAGKKREKAETLPDNVEPIGADRWAVLKNDGKYSRLHIERIRTLYYIVDNEKIISKPQKTIREALEVGFF